MAILLRVSGKGGIREYFRTFKMVRAFKGHKELQHRNGRGKGQEKIRV